jgi:hypothetical protein
MNHRCHLRPAFQSFGCIQFASKKQNMDVVVAAYKESLAWLQDLPVSFRVFVYLKDAERLAQVQKEAPRAIVQVLPNVGRESHTYLHHIVTQYESLAPYTFFFQGNPWDHVRKDQVEDAIQDVDTDFLPLGGVGDCDGNGFPHHYQGIPVGKVHKELFGEERDSFRFVAGAQFRVSSSHIHKLPKETYQFLLDKHQSIELLPWCMERFWLKMFA